MSKQRWLLFPLALVLLSCDKEKEEEQPPDVEHYPDFFCPGEPGLFQPLGDRLLRDGDPYLVLPDYRSYVECQERVSLAYRDWRQWTRMSILNTANMGKLSSDRSIREYAEEIWHVDPIPVQMK